jgi:hypothetical protein
VRVKAWLREGAERAGAALEPEETSAAGIRWSTWAAALLVGGLAGLELHLGLGRWADFAAGAGLAWLLVGLGEVLFRLLRWLVGSLGRFLTVAGCGAVVAVAGLLGMFGLPPEFAVALALLVVAVNGILGAALWRLASGDPRRLRLAAAAVAAALANGALVAGALWPGSGSDPVEELVPPRGEAPRMWAELLERGPYEVDHLTYGSGDDRRRSEYRDGVAFTTPAVDGSALLTGLRGWKAVARQRIWGFGAEALPLNARVWYPADLEEAAPLALVVHGNHNMLHYSDPGYAWLGEHLASRGFFVASVDQNFLNGGPVVGGVAPENDARGWLLLEHLRLWRQWAEEPEHPFFGRVDLERVALIGHSRGGEAVTVAAAFNRLPFYPDDGSVAFDYGFGIQGVVAIAPVDGQYRPAGRRTPIADVTYLTLQGGHDGDVSLFLGDRQLQRVELTPGSGHFKAALYLHHANHGQFNTVWGRRDLPGPGSWLLNLAPLLDGEAQRQAGKLLITAFLEERLLGRGELRPLFADPGLAGDALPATFYAARYADDQEELLADFGAGLDLTRGRRPGVQISGRHLLLWAQRDLELRGKVERGDGAQVVGWRLRGPGEEPPSWGLSFDRPPEVGPEPVLLLDLAHLDRDAPPVEDEEAPVFLAAGNVETQAVPAAAAHSPAGAQREDSGAGLRPSLFFSVVLTDAGGTAVSLPLSRFGSLHPPLPVRHTKLAWLDKRRYKGPTEPVVQTFQLPLVAFVDAEPAFDPGELVEIRLRFDGSEEGVLAISRVALRGVAAAASSTLQ